MTTHPRRLATIMTLLAMGACAAGPATTFLRHEAPDSRYRAVAFNTSGGYVMEVRYRTFNESGKAAMCGYLAGEAGFVDKDITELWFQEADVIVGGQVFGKGDFLKHQWARAGGSPPTANCVQSTLDWNTTMTTTPVGFQGGTVRRVY